MEFGILGPLHVAVGGRDVPLPAKQRVMVAALLMRANRVVPADTLIKALWDETPPPSAPNTLHGYVKRLRQMLDGEATKRLATRKPGYLLTVADDELDLDMFTAACDRGRQAARAGDWAAAAGQFRAALALWRGDPLADIPSPPLQRDEVPRLAELRLQALESRLDADLKLGRHAELTAELRQLTSTHPLREQFHGQLMLALYRSSRQADALTAYRAVGRMLRHELGIAPGPELQQLHQRILTADPALMTADSAAAVVSAAEGEVAAPPRQLPTDAADFTGRDEQVKLLCHLLAAEPNEHRPGAVVISAIAGMGGIGKTTLAVHVAHALRDRFPDGQLFASLQGASSPLAPADALAMFLRDLGVPDARIPAGETERAARYRTELADRRVLVVLDDARDATQVRPLVPGTADSAVIVTSRTALLGLPGAAHVDLGVLPPAATRALFTAIVGADRAAAEPAATEQVLTSCAGLPLAVRIAGSRLVSRPAWSIASLAARLADERGRLGELTAGDLAVRASFAVSYDALPAGEPGRPRGANPARVFRLLGLAEPGELSLPAIAALAGSPPDEVAAALDTLTDTHLAESPAPDRFRLHDLLRSYAAELAASSGSERDATAAIGRMLRWYATQAVAAFRALAIGSRLPSSALFHVATADMASPAQAVGWIRAELANLVAAVRQAAAIGQHDITVQIALALWAFFRRTRRIEDWLATSQAGVQSARILGDDDALSWLVNSLGQVYSEQRRFTESGRCFREALEIRQRTGDRTGTATILNSLAVDLHYQDRSEEELEYLRQALAIHTALGDEFYVGVVLSNIGATMLRLKRHDEALDYLGQGLTIVQQADDDYAIGLTEFTIAETYLDVGRLDDAVEHYQRGWEAHAGTERNHPNHARALISLGTALATLGRPGEAREAWLTAIPILDRHSDPLAAELRTRLADLESN